MPIVRLAPCRVHNGRPSRNPKATLSALRILVGWIGSRTGGSHHDSQTPAMDARAARSGRLRHRDTGGRRDARARRHHRQRPVRHGDVDRRDLCVLGARRRRNRRLHVHARPVDGRLHLAEDVYGARTGHPRLRRHCDRRPRCPRLGPAELDDLAARAPAASVAASAAPPPPLPPPAEPTPPAQPAQPAKPAATKPLKKNLCPPKRALGKPISLGCSALQVVTSTDLAQPFADALAKGMGGLGTLGPLKQATPDVLRGLKQGKHLIELGLHEAAQRRRLWRCAHGGRGNEAARTDPPPLSAESSTGSGTG